MIAYDWTNIEKVKCHKEVVWKDLQHGDEIEKREYLSVTLKSSGIKQLTVIMMNPSNADSEESDATINKIVKHFNKNDNKLYRDIKTINIVNLFSICSSKSKELNEKLEKIILNNVIEVSDIIFSNRSMIETKISDSEFIVLAWGDCPIDFYATTYFREIESVMNFLKKFEKKKTFIFHVENKRAKARGVAYDNELTSLKNPVHPSNGEIKSMIKIKIDALNRIIPYKHIRI
ncbi:DUF1643 domain-containing protein [Paenibacillus xylanexedens]|uniref:DUF1643 domain-containing protein n=1 Tax=Paenibacillus xylanexedens TaxID=528191 RepID=UPI001C8EAEB7|nr:DUF1643 domain-containing protein [Paenibacillus xylanexedens]MBY0117985.1 DUF1643 domain-containing protein [Paenibacillus xylanexedens]